MLGFRSGIPKPLLASLRDKYAPAARRRIWDLENATLLWLATALRPEDSLAAVAQEVWQPVATSEPGLADRTVNSGRWAEVRARVPEGLLQELAEYLATQGATEGSGIGEWYHRRTLWLDGSTFTVPDEPELREHFGGPRNQHGPSGFPMGRMVNLGVAGTRILIGSGIGPYRDSEASLARPLLERLQPGDVLLGDRYFANAENLARVKQRGADAVMRKHSGLKPERHPHRLIGKNDWVIELPVPREARQRNPKLPPTVSVRVFRVMMMHQGRLRALWIETTLLHPRKYPKTELGMLYLRRWGAETSYRELKCELHLKRLRSKTVAGIARELQAHLAAYNFVRLQMLRAAQQAGLNPLRLSFREAVRCLHYYGGALRSAPSLQSRTHLVATMLRQIAASQIRHRPERSEPRALKSRFNPFPRLRCPRSQWRAEHGLAA